MMNSNCKILVLSLMLTTGSACADEAVRLNDGLPVMVDSKTELNDISVKDRTVIYTFQLKDISPDEAFNLRQENKENIEKNACQDENINCLFEKDFDVKFVYKIKNESILEVNIDRKFCKTMQG